MKSIIERRTGLKLQNIPRKNSHFGGGHVVGKKYFCGYWNQVYTVLEIKEVPVLGWVVVCKWDDGKTNEHSTSLQPRRDYEVLEVV